MIAHVQLLNRLQKGVCTMETCRYWGQAKPVVAVSVVLAVADEVIRWWE